jgi:hypothetical protein
MESDLTGIYQRLSPKLHFNAANFQAYVKAKEGTNFILLHFWFHTLIVLLHQPTLLHSFGGSIQHLYPNSRELSMSSAKTIADILSFSELVDGKSFIGNPFTSQPMYIAACAFLMESAYYSSPSSRGTSPPSQPLLSGQSSGFVMPNMDSSNSSERKSNARHILLASAAKENYQRCYKALKALDAYWEGTRYILTVLDQKAKGIVDPLLYTEEDMENTTGLASVGQFSPSGWPGSKHMDSDQSSGRPQGVADVPSDGKSSPKIDPSQGKCYVLFSREAFLLTHTSIAIGWALTGAINSSQPNLSLLYQMPTTTTHTDDPPDKPTYSSQYSHSYPPLHAQTNTAPRSSFVQAVTHNESMPSPLAPKYPSMPPRAINTNPPYFLPMGSPYPESSRASGRAQSYSQNLQTGKMDTHPPAYHYDVSSTQQQAGGVMVSQGEMHPGIITDNNAMMIESHDVDMNALHQQDSFPFSNGEILPWLEYLPQDVLSFFGEHPNYPLMSPEDSTSQPQ